MVSTSQFAAFLNCSEFKASLLWLLLALGVFVNSSDELQLSERAGGAA